MQPLLPTAEFNGRRWRF